MSTPFSKLTTTIDTKLLEEVRAIAAGEGKQLQAVIEEALRAFVASRERAELRAEVVVAFGESLLEFGPLYRKLAK